MIATLCDKILKFRMTLVVISLVLTAAFIYKSTFFVLYDDPNRWPPRNNPSVKLNDSMQEGFGGANLVTIQVTVKQGDIFNVDTLRKVKRINDELALVWGIVPCNLISLGAIRVRYLEATEEILVNIPLMESVPKNAKEMERVVRGVHNNPLIYGSLVSTDDTSTIILADFRTTQPEGIKVKLPTTDPVTIYKEVMKITKPENDANHIVRAVGTPIIIGWVNSEGLPYILGAFVVFTLGIVIVLYFSLRKKRAVFLALILGIMATCWGFGLYAFIYGSILQSSSAFIAPFIIMAAVACHSVQFFRRFFYEEYTEGVEPRKAVKNTVVALTSPLFVSLATDAAAFVILAAIPFNNVCVLGQITFLGFLGIIVLFYCFLIPMISLVPPEPLEKLSRKGVMIGFVEKHIGALIRRFVMPTRTRWVVMGCVVVILLVSIFRISGIEVGQDNTYAIHNYLTKSYKSNPIFLMEEEFKKKFKGVYTLSVLIKTKEEGGLLIPENLKKVDAFSSYLEKVPGVAGCSALPVYFKLMNWFINGGDKAYWAISDDKRVIGFYHNQLVGSEPGSFDGVADYEVQSCPLYAYVEDTRSETVSRVFKAASDYAREKFNDDNITAFVGGGTIGLTKAFNDNIQEWMILSFIFSALASYVIVLLLIRSAIAGFLLMLPLFVSSVIWLFLVDLCGIEMNSLVTTGLAIANGVGIDANIYFLYRFREEFVKLKDFQGSLIDCFTKIGIGLLFSFGALIVGLWILIPIPLYIGYVGFIMGLILFICLIMSFVISPVLWSVFKPRFLFEKREDWEATKHATI